MTVKVKSGSLTSGLELPGSEELVEALYERPGVRIERIVSSGQASPDGHWYDQDSDEWVLVVAGSARLRIDGEAEDRKLGEGDYVFLPAHCRHRVAWTRSEPPTVWLVIHMFTEC